MDGDECVICYDHYTVGIVTECGHRCCLKCGLRYKFISNKSGCPICLREIRDDEMKFKVTKNKNEKFRQTEDSYLWANCIVCDPDEIDEIEELMTRSCQLCKTEFYDNQTLMKHYSAKHKRHLCELCVEHRCEFPFEYVIYSIAELNAHRTEKTIGNGHPMCGFCRERFYTADMLAKHCRKAHELCYLCERLGKKNEYYKNYSELENHFKKVHYTCSERMCLDARCYAFIDEVELAAHKASLHPTKKEHKIRIQGPSQANRKITEKKPVTPPEEEAAPEPPKHLNRSELLRSRDMKSKYTNLIKRNYASPDEVAKLTAEYDELAIELDEYAARIRELLGDKKTVEFIERISTYLLPDRTEDIKKNFPKIKRAIEFAPIKMEPKKEKEQKQTAQTKKEEPKSVEESCAKIPEAPKPPANVKLSWSSALTKSAWNNKPGQAVVKPIHVSNLEIKLPAARPKEPKKEEKEGKKKHRTFVIE
ncbi:E3 ubiquitin-protein ligase [Nematocida minor]|uniref:E3 ubiquitin-protein ligase n=1 Tax=Nematocida minor TaxID=1912983 RepID=UPI00221EE474|nr:E3 ubiquitin-protein ligase [Nematocida minor]KAI5192808.1 E3 ubiquitin-protein ligase [Nematocida minor]